MPECGASGVGRSSTPNRPSLERAARARYPLAVGAGGVGGGTLTSPTSRALGSCLCALCGQHEGARRGGSYCLGAGRSGWGARARLTALPCGVRPGSATHWLWVRGLWEWGPVTNPTARIPASWLDALWGPQECARGGASVAWMWCVWVGALLHARTPVLRACDRGLLPAG